MFVTNAVDRRTFAFAKKPKQKKTAIVNNLQGLSLSDGPNPFDTTGSNTGTDTSVSNPTSASDYLKSFTDFANQAATSAAQIQASARQVAAAYRAPLAPVSAPQRAVNAVSNFSRSNTPVMLAIAGVLAAVLVVPRLMRR
jgi:hypothetical protein